MINIPREWIDKPEEFGLEEIGNGAVAKVYRKGKNAYKIYHKVGNAGMGRLYFNPNIIYRKSRINRIIKRGKRLKHTNLIQDTIFIDGKFAGVMLPYYIGRKLSEMLDADFRVKQKLSRQLIRNSKELTDNLIYPSDYALRNFIDENGEIRIIDLDDLYTKYYVCSNPLLRRKAIRGLDREIKLFFGEGPIYPFSERVRKILKGKGLELSSDYEGIEDYLIKKERVQNIILIDINKITEERIKKISSFHNYKIAIIYEKRMTDYGAPYDDNYYLNIISMFYRNGITNIDFVLRDNLGEYISNFNAGDVKYGVYFK